MSEIDNKICIVNRTLGFIKIYTWDSTLQEVILNYCEKHSALWNVFLGWRRSFEVNSNCYMCFWIPTRKFHSLKKLAEKEKECKREDE